MSFSTEFLSREPAEVYHGRSGEYLTSHLLADFRRCPLLYHRKLAGLVPDEDRPAYLVGRAAHTVILEGERAFQASFAVGGPVNPRTGLPFGTGTKAWAEWAEQQPQQVLTTAQADLVRRMAAGVQAHSLAAELLATGIPEGVVRTEYGGRKCQSRLDWFDPHRGIVDLKTVDNLDYFEADARRYGYVSQLAFYRAVVATKIGLQMPCFLLAVEKREPFRVGVWQLTDEALQFAEHENRAAIERLQHCEAEQLWETGYETLRVFDAA